MRGLIAAALGLAAMFASRRAVAIGQRRRAMRRLRPSQGRVLAAQLLPPPSWLAIALEEAAITAEPRLITTAWIGALIVGPLTALVVAGPGLAAAIAASCGAGPWLALRLASGRRAARIEAALPVALEGMARTLRSGGSLRHAVFEAGGAPGSALASDLRVVAAQIERGAPLTVALEAWSERCPLGAVRLAVAALALGADTGGAQARAIDGVAATIRERLAAAADVRAQATQARASGAVIALSPIAFCALASATDPRTATFLFRTAPGLVLLATGLGLDALGAVCMSRITRVVG